MILTPDVEFILKRLNEKGHRADVVGGPVRDFLRGVTPSDYDINTSATPEETKAAFSDFKTVDTGIKHGTVTVRIDHESFEVTTYRVDGEYEETIFSKEKVVSEPVTEVKKVGTKQRVTLASFKNSNAPISDLNVPSDLKLDKNGIPVDYAYCVSGKATAYTGDPATASGRTPMPGHIAVDPKEFPYGTELYVVSADGSYVYGYCVAADTGGFVKMGNTDIDLYMDNEDMCCDWGNRNVKIYVLDR